MITSPKDFTIGQWALRLLSGEPHLAIGAELNDADPYMLRWYVIPRNHRVNVYIHKFLRDDDDRALHDHPWWFVSLILKGGYIEMSETDEGKTSMLCRTSVADVRSPFWRRCVAFRPATYRHRVALPHGRDGEGVVSADVPRVPCWTLIVTGPKSRLWGFWCRDRTTPRCAPADRFVPWNEWDTDGGCGEAN